MPVHYPEAAGKPYRPSNGTEGMMFEEEFCCRCHVGIDECDIVVRAHAFSLRDSDYPSEWVYDADGRPTCTAFDNGKPKRCPNTLELF